MKPFKQLLTETWLYQLLKQNTSPHLDWTRLETSTITGVPDCLVLGKHCMFMVELKIQRTKGPPELSGTQKGFARRYMRLLQFSLNVVSIDKNGDVRLWCPIGEKHSCVLFYELENNDWKAFTNNLLVSNNGLPII